MATQGMKDHRWTTKVVVVTAVLALVLYTATRPSSTSPFVASGDPVALPLPGALTPLSADEFEGVLVGLRGTPVIVNVWASWCVVCRTEMPLLERTGAADLGKVVIIGVASKDDIGLARAFLNEFGVTYPNIFDSTNEIRGRLGLRGFPTTYVFGADGKLRSSIVGGLTEQRLASVLEDLNR